ncbi:hypothetical protein CDES_03335 [Corynebacterium deserti GIMN1.010]|uniref:DUF3500 domain-containing protein n=1 Tax=Corynebacterium deserti GIMN1.010 TaxID=931089 RepID=A0A0M4CWG5_9CORY|nr:hypothetical protein CDES_03335 [Corynebacterium deserti GIMN1.010]
MTTSGSGSNEPPAKVAAAMQTTKEASTSTSVVAGPAAETSLTAAGFLQYLDEEQRAALLGDGLDLSTLSWANQVTALRVLESLFNEDAFQVLSAVITHVAQEPGENAHHFLTFSEEPATDKVWELTLDGPTVGLEVTFHPDGQIAFEDAHLGLSAAEVAHIAESLDPPMAQSPMRQTAYTLLASLNDTQRAALEGPGLWGAQLNDEQKQLFLSMTTNWVSPTAGDAGTSQQAEIANTLDDTYFIWNEHPDGSIFFAVNGPEVDFEYSEAPGLASEGLAAQGEPQIESSFTDPNSTS